VRIWIAESKTTSVLPRAVSKIHRPKSAVRNAETPKRGQSAESPDRFIVKKRLISRRFFLE
jgi:hypothetical protein